MNNMHPHWHVDIQESSEEVADVSTKSTSASQSTGKQMKSISRKPAAIIGIALALGAGFLYVQGGSLLGQFTGSGSIAGGAVIIAIKNTGFTPATIKAKPGQTVQWTNQDEIPHILGSDTLLLADGNPLQTSPIFKGKQTSIKIPMNIKPGTYTYVSRTNSALEGSIVIDPPPPPPASSSSKSSASSVANSQTSSEAAPVLGQVSEQTPPTPPAGATGVPTNPYTVSNPLKNPLPGNASTKPLWQQTGTKPGSQPESGPGLWIVSILSIGGVLFVTRKAFTA